MAESTGGNSQTETSPSTGPSSFGSAIVSQGLATVHEVPYHNARYNENASLDKRIHSARRASTNSLDASLRSSSGPKCGKKKGEASPQRPRNTKLANAGHETWRRSEIPSRTITNSNHRDTGLDRGSESASPKKEKLGGFRSTLRRMFGRRSNRDRKSMPTPTFYPRHDPEEFITSATDVKTKRSASVPTNGLLRTSSLGSHPPFQATPIPAGTTSTPVPPKPELQPPEHHPRPRRASVPGLICNKPESSELGAVTTGIGLQNAQEPHIDAQNIGFAVTNGSNPRRRSRSVGAYRDTDHRSSPIQWRQWRRSDEIKYWRQSADRGSLGITRFESPEPAQKYDVDTVGNDGGGLGEHNEDFNFGLSDVALPIRDRIGLEERLVTLEIKLMDFEYAIAKLQAGSLSPSRRYSQQFETSKRQNSFSSYTSSSDNLSPALSQGSPPENPSKFGSDQTPNLRPTSVATTLKAGTSGQYSWPRKGSADSVVRSSLTGLTIDHYTTLVTLVRCEQNARIQLEHQVSMLQQRLDQISPPHSSYPRVQPLSQHLHSRSLSSQQRRHGFVDTATREDTDFGNLRRRSSNHSTDGTDTDDDAYHEVYVTPDITPVERGGHERGAFERVAGVEEGMAF